jgi:hypothetical protein
MYLPFPGPWDTCILPVTLHPVRKKASLAGKPARELFRVISIKVAKIKLKVLR